MKQRERYAAYTLRPVISPILLLLLVYFSAEIVSAFSVPVLLPRPLLFSSSTYSPYSFSLQAARSSSSTAAVKNARPTSTSSSTKKANSSNSKKRKSSARKKKRQRTKTPLSETDLVDHVSNLYLYGPGGVLHRDDDDDDSDEQQQQRHNDFVQALHHKPTLLLNADYQPMNYLPLSLWTWQDAIKAVFSGKVTVVDVYPDVVVRAASLEISLPSVIALNEYVPQHQQQSHCRPAFTKRNVFLRDVYKCQYCCQRFHTRDLTLDHVVPRSMGGRLNWENAVTCCSQCNGRKGCLPVHKLRDVGMKLHRPPVCPTQYELAAIAGRMLPRRVHPTWEPYLENIFTVSYSSS